MREAAAGRRQGPRGDAFMGLTAAHRSAEALTATQSESMSVGAC
jgi:hypothetical protein